MSINSDTFNWHKIEKIYKSGKMVFLSHLFIRKDNFLLDLDGLIYDFVGKRDFLFRLFVAQKPKLEKKMRTIS